MRAKDTDGLAGLHQQRFVVTQRFELTHDGVERRPVARGFAGSAVNDQILRALGHLGVEIIHEHAQGGFLLPALAAKGGAAGRANVNWRQSIQGRHMK